MKTCPPGEYYCHDMKKCKKIPSGYHVGARGYLAKDDDENGKKNGNGNGTNGHSNGNGNGSNGGGNGGGVSESTYLPRRTGNIIDVYVGWRGKGYAIKMFFPQIKKPSRREVLDQVRKVYPGAQLWSYQVSNYEPGEPLLQTGGRN